MKKSQETKMTLLMSIVSLLLCGAMMIGTTYAWFTDTASSGTNTITAGRLDVELEYANSLDDGGAAEWNQVDDNTNVFMPDALWEPGHTEYVYLKVKNVGNLALKYKLSLTPFGDELGAPEQEFTSKTGEKTKLSQHIVAYTAEDETPAKPDDRSDLWIKDAAEEQELMGNFDAIGQLNPAEGSDAPQDGVENKLLPNDEKIFMLVAYMPISVGNEANWVGADQGAQLDPQETNPPTVYFGLNLLATQVPDESDSFGDQYDAEATYPEKKIATNEELQQAIAEAKPGDTLPLGEGEFDAGLINSVPGEVAISGTLGADGKPLTKVDVRNYTIKFKDNAVSNIEFDIELQGQSNALVVFGENGKDNAVDVKNCVFKSTNANNRAAVTMYGEGTFSGCTFECPNGRGIGWSYAYGDVLIEDCTFNCPNAQAIHFDGGKGNVTISGCTVNAYLIAIGASLDSVTMKDSTIDSYVNVYTNWITSGNTFNGVTDFDFKVDNLTFTSTDDNFDCTSVDNGAVFYGKTSTATITVDGKKPEGWIK